MTKPTVGRVDASHVTAYLGDGSVACIRCGACPCHTPAVLNAPCESEAPAAVAVIQCRRCNRTWAGIGAVAHAASHDCRPAFKVRWPDVWVYLGAILAALALIVWAWFM